MKNLESLKQKITIYKSNMNTTQYDQKIGDISSKEFWKTFEEIIESKIEKVLIKHIPILNEFVNYYKKNERLFTTKEVCTRLCISRQTLNTWFSSQKTKDVLKGISVKSGNRNYYKYFDLVKILESNTILFTNRYDPKYISRPQNEELDSLSVEVKSILNNSISYDLSNKEILEKVEKGETLTKEEKKRSDFLLS